VIAAPVTRRSDSCPAGGDYRGIRNVSGTITEDLAVLDPLRGELHTENGTRLAVYGPVPNGLPIVGWVKEHRDGLMAALREHSAVLVRGAVHTPEALEEITRIIGGDPLSYTERTTPRSTVRGNVYTSTEYPASQIIPQHNETSYARVAPRWLFFACTVPAASGGATPLADSAQVPRRPPCVDGQNPQPRNGFSTPCLPRSSRLMRTLVRPRRAAQFRGAESIEFGRRTLTFLGYYRVVAATAGAPDCRDDRRSAPFQSHDEAWVTGGIEAVGRSRCCAKPRLLRLTFARSGG
jgi:Taurine catabolism dioxygenase TauD, TfdA family